MRKTQEYFLEVEKKKKLSVFLVIMKELRIEYSKKNVMIEDIFLNILLPKSTEEWSSFQNKTREVPFKSKTLSRWRNGSIKKMQCLVVWSCLKRNMIRVFKPKFLHTRLNGDFGRLFEFCLRSQGLNDNFFKNMMFTDETTFTANWVVSSQNFRFWTAENHLSDS